MSPYLQFSQAHSHPTASDSNMSLVGKLSLSTGNTLIYLFIYLFIAFLGPHVKHMEVPRLGVESVLWSRLSQPTPQLTAMLDPLTHSARPGIEPTSSRILVGFITAEHNRHSYKYSF